MAYITQFLRLRYIFSVLTTDEVADTGLVLSNAEGDPFDAEAALADVGTGMLDDLFAAYTGMTLVANGFLWGNYSRLVGLKVSAHGVDGRYLTSPVERAYSSSNAGSSLNVEPQNTVVLSLWSGETLGRANYGRMYLPHTTAALETGTPRCSAGDASDMADAGANFVTAVNTFGSLLAGDPQVVVASSVGSGINKLVTQTRVGRVVDTQRRRRNKIPEDYAVSPVV